MISTVPTAVVNHDGFASGPAHPDTQLRMVTCPTCNGARYTGMNGTHPTSRLTQCFNCGGTGKTKAPPEIQAEVVTPPPPPPSPLADPSDPRKLAIPAACPELPWTLVLKGYGPGYGIMRPTKHYLSGPKFHLSSIEIATEAELAFFYAVEFYKRECERITAELDSVKAELAVLKEQNADLLKLIESPAASAVSQAKAD